MLKREHIVEGMLRALGMIDSVIEVIRTRYCPVLEGDDACMVFYSSFLFFWGGGR